MAETALTSAEISIPGLSSWGLLLLRPADLLLNLFGYTQAYMLNWAKLLTMSPCHSRDPSGEQESIPAVLTAVCVGKIHCIVQQPVHNFITCCG